MSMGLFSFFKRKKREISDEEIDFFVKVKENYKNFRIAMPYEKEIKSYKNDIDSYSHFETSNFSENFRDNIDIITDPAYSSVQGNIYHDNN
ncbi:hypothetical protein HPMG_01112 [Helicobacter pullorum MIT 98-5489]|uniref:Uncharacterized protein n=2 Tax=Helicobacter pullorum TaxID=35818 RepID=C5F061_9HELI|nr:hypothetical protein HPMG_01112 [Helicobacter pullorum MIT 98-5489]